jgi:hypothetical protein
MAAPTSTDGWIEAKAKVAFSDYRSAKLRDVDFESPADRSYFLITFSYLVNGKFYLDTFESPSPYKIDHLIEISYNPTNPQENSRSEQYKSKRMRITAWIAGAGIGLLLIYLGSQFGWKD